MTTSFPYYPINDFGPVMKGMVIGGLGIFHVFLAQFAIGAGMLMCYFQWIAQQGKSQYARRFLDSYFKILVLISFVVGALTGVGMWFTTIQVSPRTIGTMVDVFHWLWATEWTFFALEVVSGYAFYRYSAILNDRQRMTLLVLYTVAAWFSLFWINGILSWQLTPGDWVESRNIWAGFFNPSFWPSLVYRSIVSVTIASLIATVVINTFGDLDRPAKSELIHIAARPLIFMVAMPIIGFWYLRTIPYDSRSWLFGGSAAMSLFFAGAVVASLLIGLYSLIAIIRQKMFISGPTATLLVALAFQATAAGEFVREGVRKPYSIRETLYSNSISKDDIEHLRAVGSVTNDPFPLRDADEYPNEQLQLGAKVYRMQCSVCHTIAGANGLTHLTGSWTMEQKRMNIAKLQHTKPFMPPFAGNAEEAEALVQLLTWTVAGGKQSWPESSNPETIAMIDRWLAEAGIEPGVVRERTVHVGKED